MKSMKSIWLKISYIWSEAKVWIVNLGRGETAKQMSVASGMHPVIHSRERKLPNKLELDMELDNGIP